VTEVDDDLGALAGRIGAVVRATRTARGLSLGELGRRAGLSKTILARIEAGAGNPSVETLWRVTRALDLPLGALLAPEDAPRTRLVAAGTGERITADSGMAGHLLHAAGQGARTELYELAFPPGTTHATDGHLPGTAEVVLCLEGALAAGPVGEERGLAPGDALWFAADGPHRYVAGPAGARIVELMLYPPAAAPA
jgi:XRE family transcriptional regulator, regulator of sulfur utilization